MKEGRNCECKAEESFFINNNNIIITCCTVELQPPLVKGLHFNAASS